MDSLIGKFGKHMDNFKTTRKLLHNSGSGVQSVEASDLSEEEGRLRNELEWQTGLTEALASYSKSVAEAFQMLEVAHRRLLDAGIIDTGLDADSVQALARGCAQARRLAVDKANALREPVDQRRAKLAMCREKVKEFDTAWAEFKHYDDKMAVLKQEYQDALNRGRQEKCEKFAAVSEAQAVDRNKAKKREAESVANEARARAEKSLRSVAAAHDTLCNTAQDVFFNTAEAVQRLSSPSAAAPPPAKALEGPKDEGALTSQALASPMLRAPPMPQPSAPAASSKEAAEEVEDQPSIEQSMTPGYAKSLLSAPNLMSSLCQSYFRKYDANSDGMLDVHEALALVEDLQECLEIPPAARPNEQQVGILIARYGGQEHPNCLSAEQFKEFFTFALQATLAKRSAAAAVVA